MLLLFALMMTQSKENQVTLYSDKVTRLGCIEKKGFCECALCSNVCLKKKKKEKCSAPLPHTITSPQSLHWLSPMEATLNIKGTE